MMLDITCYKKYLPVAKFISYDPAPPIYKIVYEKKNQIIIQYVSFNN